jgi:hypothetical protein
MPDETFLSIDISGLRQRIGLRQKAPADADFAEMQKPRLAFRVEIRRKVIRNQADLVFK